MLSSSKVTPQRFNIQTDGEETPLIKEPEKVDCIPVPALPFSHPQLLSLLENDRFNPPLKETNTLTSAKLEAYFRTHKTALLRLGGICCRATAPKLSELREQVQTALLTHKPTRFGRWRGSQDARIEAEATVLLEQIERIEKQRADYLKALEDQKLQANVLSPK